MTGFVIKSGIFVMTVGMRSNARKKGRSMLTWVVASSTTDCSPRRRKVQGLPQHRYFLQGELSFFVYGFSKSELGNLRKDDEDHFKKMARHVLSLTDAQLAELLANGQFEEVTKDAKKIPQ